MGVSDQEHGSRIFDQPYWGNVVETFFPGAKRIDEFWLKRTVCIHVSLGEWETWRTDREGRARLIEAFSGLPDRVPALNYVRKVSEDAHDGFPAGEEFVGLTIVNVDFPARRRIAYPVRRARE